MFAQRQLELLYVRSGKGVALYLVLGVLIVTALVATLSMNIILSQSRLTHHSVSRTQAYYAAKMGMHYAIEMLNNQDTTWSTPGNYTICRSGCTKNEPDLPNSINNVTVTVGDTGSGLDGTRKLDITVFYSYDSKQ